MSVHSRSIAATVLMFSSVLLSAMDFDPVGLIGLDPPSAYEVLGPPQEVFSFRGTEASEDNVVYFYPDFIYLFWFKNRVWQVRCDGRFEGTLFGVRLGMRREEVENGNGRTKTVRGDSVYFDVIEAQYPIRVRLVFIDGILSDVYVYRSDF
jgi:hypothetical protein